ELQDRLLAEAQEGWVGRRLEVLVERVGDDGACEGRSFREAPDAAGLGRGVSLPSSAGCKGGSVRGEIIGVGTELLLGQIVNTNAAWIGQRLADVGWDCLRHTVVGDNEGRIAEAIQEALGRADAVILTGGLGPTQDDVTREALAEVAGVALVRRPELEQWLRERFARMSIQRMAEMNLRQADVPEGARTIDNPRGTAPGLVIEIDGKPVYAGPLAPRGVG